MSGNTQENSHKSNKYNISFNNINGHVTPTITEGNNNFMTTHISGDIKINDNPLDKIDLFFKIQ